MGDPEHGGHRIEREQDIGAADRQGRQEQRGQGASSVAPRHEPAAVVAARDRERGAPRPPADCPRRWIVVAVTKECTAVASSASPKSRNVNEKSREAPRRWRSGPSEDEREDDADRHRLRLLPAGTANAAMMMRKTKRLSIERLFSTRYPRSTARRDPAGDRAENDAEQQRDGHVERRPANRFPQPDAAPPPSRHAEVKREQPRYRCERGRPPEGSDAQHLVSTYRSTRLGTSLGISSRTSQPLPPGIGSDLQTGADQCRPLVHPANARAGSMVNRQAEPPVAHGERRQPVAGSRASSRPACFANA